MKSSWVLNDEEKRTRIMRKKANAEKNSTTISREFGKLLRDKQAGELNITPFASGMYLTNIFTLG